MSEDDKSLVQMQCSGMHNPSPFRLSYPQSHNVSQPPVLVPNNAVRDVTMSSIGRNIQGPAASCVPRGWNSKFQGNNMPQPTLSTMSTQRSPGFAPSQASNVRAQFSNGNLNVHLPSSISHQTLNNNATTSDLGENVQIAVQSALLGTYDTLLSRNAPNDRNINLNLHVHVHAPSATIPAPEPAQQVIDLTGTKKIKEEQDASNSRETGNTWDISNVLNSFDIPSTSADKNREVVRHEPVVIVSDDDEETSPVLKKMKNTFKCTVCEKVFNNKRGLAHHMESKHNTPSRSPPRTDTQLKSVESQDTAQSSEGATYMYSFQCPCPKKFSNYESLTKHMNECHNPGKSKSNSAADSYTRDSSDIIDIPVDDVSSANEAKSDEDRPKARSSRSRTVRRNTNSTDSGHSSIKITASAPRYKCSSCKESFERPYLLAIHVKTKHSKRARVLRGGRRALRSSSERSGDSEITTNSGSQPRSRRSSTVSVSNDLKVKPVSHADATNYGNEFGTRLRSSDLISHDSKQKLGSRMVTSITHNDSISSFSRNTKTGKINCSYCQKEFHKQGIHKHLKRCKKDQRKTSPVTSKEFSLSSNTKVKPGDEKINCSYCHYNFPKQGFHRHLMYCRKKDAKKKTRRQYSCKKCHKVFNSLAVLRKHAVGCSRVVGEIKKSSFNHSGPIMKGEPVLMLTPVPLESLTPGFKHKAMKSIDPVECKLCGKTLSNYWNHKRHMEQTHGKLKRCRTCKKTFSNKAALHEHIGQSHGELYKFQCTFCGARILSKLNFSEHVAAHRGQYQCLVCLRNFKAKLAMVHHVRVVHAKSEVGRTTQSFTRNAIATPKVTEIPLQSLKPVELQHEVIKRTDPVQCKLCRKKLSNNWSYEQHMKRVHGTSKCCRRCNKTFPHKAALHKHRGQSHGELYKFHCTFCGYRLQNKKNFSEHVAAHKGQYQCLICLRSFNTELAKEHHVRVTHVKSKVGKTTKSVTGNAIATPKLKIPLQSLKPVELKHEVIKKTDPVQCKKCGKILCNNWSYERHMDEKHGTSKRCLHCYKTFPHKAALHEHRGKRHGDIYKFQCTFCGYRLQHERNLSGHVAAHHGQYQCLVCLRSFKAKLAMTHHVRVVHAKSEKTTPEEANATPKARESTSHTIRESNATAKAGVSTPRKIEESHMTSEVKKSLDGRGSRSYTSERFRKCKECKTLFPNVLSMQLHYASVHDDSYEIQCTYCGRMHQHSSIYKNHLDFHRNRDMPYKCLDCGILFKTCEERMVHLVEDHDLEVENQHTCSVCKHSFYTRQLLDYHMNTDHSTVSTSTTPSKSPKTTKRNAAVSPDNESDTDELTDAAQTKMDCDFCGKTFTRKYHFDKHMKKHEMEETCEENTPAKRKSKEYLHIDYKFIKRNKDSTKSETPKHGKSSEDLTCEYCNIICKSPLLKIMHQQKRHGDKSHPTRKSEIETKPMCQKTGEKQEQLTCVNIVPNFAWQNNSTTFMKVVSNLAWHDDSIVSNEAESSNIHVTKKQDQTPRPREGASERKETDIDNCSVQSPENQDQTERHHDDSQKTSERKETNIDRPTGTNIFEQMISCSTDHSITKGVDGSQNELKSKTGAVEQPACQESLVEDQKNTNIEDATSGFEDNASIDTDLAYEMSTDDELMGLSKCIDNRDAASEDDIFAD